MKICTQDFFFLLPLTHTLFLYESIKNWIISVSMATSEYRRGKRALYFAIDARLYLKERDIPWEGSGGGDVWGVSSLDSVEREGKEGTAQPLKSADPVWTCRPYIRDLRATMWFTCLFLRKITAWNAFLLLFGVEVSVERNSAQVLPTVLAVTDPVQSHLCL